MLDGFKGIQERVTNTIENVKECKRAGAKAISIAFDFNWGLSSSANNVGLLERFELIVKIVQFLGGAASFKGGKQNHSSDLFDCEMDRASPPGRHVQADRKKGAELRKERGKSSVNRGRLSGCYSMIIRNICRQSSPNITI